MDTLLQALAMTFVPAPTFATTTTTVSASGSIVSSEMLIDDENLRSTSILGVITTASAAITEVKNEYDDFYQTIGYVDSLSDEELAKLTNEIDVNIVNSEKAKVLINNRS